MTLDPVVRRTLHALLAVLVMLAVAGPVAACDATLRLVVPYLPGGAAGMTAEVLARELRRSLERPVAVDFLPGHNGVRAASEVAQSRDPCLVLLGTVSSLVLPAIVRGAPFDPPRSFAPVALVGTAPLVLAVPTTLPVRNVHELIVLARSRPLRFGTAGTGTVADVAGGMLERLTDIRLEYVALASSADLVRELAAGRLDLALDNALVPLVSAGRARALAVSSRTRLRTLPEVPTVAEAGVPGFDATTWVALYGSPELVPAFAQQLAEHVAAALKEPRVHEELGRYGIQPQYLGPAALAAYTRSEMERWRREAEAQRALPRRNASSRPPE